MTKGKEVCGKSLPTLFPTEVILLFSCILDCSFMSGASMKYFGLANGNPLQYSCLGNLMHRGAWWVQFMGL